MRTRLPRGGPLPLLSWVLDPPWSSASITARPRRPLKSSEKQLSSLGLRQAELGQRFRIHQQPSGGNCRLCFMAGAIVPSGSPILVTSPFDQYF